MRPGHGQARPAGTVRPVSTAAKPPKTQYTCNACGASSPKWLGKCPGCGDWNTLEETVAEATGTARHRYQSLAKAAPVATLESASHACSVPCHCRRSAGNAAEPPQ